MPIKQLRRKSQKLRVFKTVYVHLPFPDLSDIETLSVPLWRLLDEHAIVIINPVYLHIDTAMRLLDTWGLHYVLCGRASSYDASPCVVGTQGEAEYLTDIPGDVEKQGGVMSAMLTWAEPRLTVNRPSRMLWRVMKGWKHIEATGSRNIDPYYYPLRKNGLDVDESLADALDSFRREWRNGNFAKWKALEALAIMLINSRLPKQTLYDLVMQSTDGELTNRTLKEWVALIEQIQAGFIKPDYGQPIKKYVKQALDDPLSEVVIEDDFDPD